MKLLLTRLILVAATCSLCISCNTVNGLGQDFQKVGQSMEKSSKFRLGGSNAASYSTPAAPGYAENQYLAYSG